MLLFFIEKSFLLDDNLSCCTFKNGQTKVKDVTVKVEYSLISEMLSYNHYQPDLSEKL